MRFPSSAHKLLPMDSNAHGLGGLGLGGGSEDFGTQIVASDDTASRCLDGDAALGWDASLFPVVDVLRQDAERAGKLGLSADCGDGSIKCGHALWEHDVYSVVNSPFPVEQRKPGWDHKHMVSKTKKQSPAAERIDYVRRMCGLEDNKAAFARWIGAESPQTVHNWGIRAKGITRDGAMLIKRATGASIDWLIEGSGEPFPNGPTLYASGAAAPDAGLEALKAEVAALKVALTVMVGEFARKRQGEAAEYAKAIRAAAPGMLRQDTISSILEVLDSVAPRLARRQSTKPASGRRDA
jgi:hypothetical protein